MKTFLKCLSLGLVFVAGLLQAADDPANPPQPTATFQTVGSQVNGTIILPRGQCAYGGYRSTSWQGYIHCFSFAADAAIPLDALTFKVSAAINRRVSLSTHESPDRVLSITSNFQLLTPQRDPAWRFSLIGSTRQGSRVGADIPEKPRSITLQMVYASAKTDGEAAPVATWTLAYPGTRQADVITLDLWVASNRDELSAKIKTRNTSKVSFAEVKPHIFD